MSTGLIEVANSTVFEFGISTSAAEMESVVEALRAQLSVVEGVEHVEFATRATLVDIGIKVTFDSEQTAGRIHRKVMKIVEREKRADPVYVRTRVSDI